MGSAEAAIAIHRALKQAQAELEASGSPKRLYAISEAAVDVSRADPTCSVCHGSGYSGLRNVMIGGEVKQLEVVCACVYARGGVDKSAIEDRFTTARKPKRRRKLGLNKNTNWKTRHGRK